jgi:hypothetical protein
VDDCACTIVRSRGTDFGRTKYTILEFNSNRLICAFHQEPTVCRSVSLELRVGALRNRAQLVPLRGQFGRKAYLTSFILTFSENNPNCKHWIGVLK